MSQFTPEQNRINTDIAKKLDLSIREVEQVIDLFWKGASVKIAKDEPCEIIIPFLGKLFANKTYIKQFNEKQNEVNNSGG